MELSIGVGTRADIDRFDFCFGTGPVEIDYAKFLRLNADEINQAKGCSENIQYDDIKDDSRLDWDYIRFLCVDHDIDSSLKESFWEMMHGEEPDMQIMRLLEELPKYPSLSEMDAEELEKFVHEFVLKTLVTTEVAYYLDDIDVTDKVGPCVGKWDELVFSTITDDVVYELKKGLHKDIYSTN